MSELLEVRGLSGGYTSAPILRGIDLTVGQGEIVALFGANGAGKTTVLRALSGVLPACSGEVRLDGSVIHTLPAWHRARLGLAHVPEGRHVFGAMTVRENLEVATVAARRSRSINDAFELFPRLGERHGQLAGTLSGGEQQMLVIARALMAMPRIVLIDEMSAGLAPVITQRLTDVLVEVRTMGVAILLVEQAPHLVADIVDRVYLLDQGSVIGHGTLEELGGAARISDVYLGVT
jgi:branched-chain amino acid transport system ATP-binding protein